MQFIEEAGQVVTRTNPEQSTSRFIRIDAIRMSRTTLPTNIIARLGSHPLTIFIQCILTLQNKYVLILYRMSMRRYKAARRIVGQPSKTTLLISAENRPIRSTQHIPNFTANHRLYFVNTER
ncbi:hypothetical protein AO268_02030 [Pseudomonas sp. ICMP 8385]|nr:hypothetical protein BLL38_28320 [Pseudomonas gessardii]PHN58586.1 hypothetical protein AO268_02030 [Pseudomonas sp. ICMP 8385]